MIGDMLIGLACGVRPMPTSIRRPARSCRAIGRVDVAMMTPYDDAMRTIIELPKDQLRALDAWRRARGVSRAEAVRRAVAILLEDEARARAAVEAAFGIWRDRAVDGLAEQERIRAEWDDR